MKSKKNGFLTFCFSCLPGAGQMFLGFMKRGISLMVLFFGTIAIISSFRINILVYLLPVIWFYAFFDAMNRNALPQEQLDELKDEFLWVEDHDLPLLSGRKIRMAAAVVMILAGVHSLLQMVWNICYDVLGRLPDWLYDSIFYDTPRVLFSLAIIIAGIYLITFRKPDQEDYDEDEDVE